MKASEALTPYGRFPAGASHHARMNLRWIFTCCQLIEELFVLIRNPVPAIDLTNAVRRATAIVFGKLGLGFDKLDFPGKIIRIAEQQSVLSQHLGAEWIVMGQDAVAEAKRLQQRGICASHHVAVNVRIRIAMQFFYEIG